MAERLDKTGASLITRADHPLIGILGPESSTQGTVEYFTDEHVADAAASQQDSERVVGLAGAWNDMKWDEVSQELERIRHESLPTPPISL